MSCAVLMDGDGGKGGDESIYGLCGLFCRFDLLVIRTVYFAAPVCQWNELDSTEDTEALKIVI